MWLMLTKRISVPLLNDPAMTIYLEGMCELVISVRV